MCRMPPSPSPGIGVVTGQAGPGLFITDVLRSRGVRVPPLAEATVKGLAASAASADDAHEPRRHRPAERDLRAGARARGRRRRDRRAGGLRAQGERRDQPGGRVSHAGGRGAAARRVRHERPPRDARPGRRALDAMGVPQYPTPEQAARAHVRARRGRVARARRDEQRSRPRLATAPALPDEPLDEHLSKRLLEALGVAHAPASRCARPRGGSCALSALGVAGRRQGARSWSIAHKASVGGVHVGIDDRPPHLDVALDAIDRMRGPVVARLPRGGAGRGRRRAARRGSARSRCGDRSSHSAEAVETSEHHRPVTWRVAPLTDLDLAELVADVDPDASIPTLSPRCSGRSRHFCSLIRRSSRSM